ncbi:ubiquitin carboxyl-terminal hydrolase CYLD-like isoform X2 [Babylonia areolata]|uniref:ubiquitin carboxyl-terminal hydrolase CYLD-like isoform X2 n=1 Tax=Babylonia areolata TaxID=304850 RepID=UPI003FD0609C
MTEVYILLKTKYGKKKKEKDRRLVNIRTNANRIELLAGTLLLKISPPSNEAVDRNIGYYESIETADTVEVQCPRSEVEKLQGAESDLLRPIPTCVERLEVYRNKDWLLEGSTLRTGDTVFVKIKGHQSELPGCLRYRGPLPDLQGLYFGVELTENRGEGTCDGTYHKNQYFKAPQDSAIFCALHKIRKQREGWQKSDRVRAGQGSVYPEMASPDDMLKIGERVMWPSDNGNELGTVRWVGRLPNDPRGEITVGVEFDNPIGTGTGKYKEERLFYTKYGHASLVPLMGLLRADPQDEMDQAAAAQDYPVDYIRQQEQLLREAQQQQQQQSQSSSYSSTPSTSSTTPAFSSSSRSQTYPESGGNVQLPSSRGSSRMGSEFVGSDGQEGLYSKATAMPPVQADNSVGVGVGVGVPLQQMEEMGLKDAVGGDDSVVNQGYLCSKQQESSCDRSQRDSKQSSTSSQSSSVSHDPDLGVGSLVEVLGKPPRYGVIRWIGSQEGPNSKVTAGLEMEEEISAGTDGTFRGERHFYCPARKALFVPLNKCRKDKRFLADAKDRASHEEFGTRETPDIAGDVSPPEVYSPEELTVVCGKQRGIQGHHNSCYLDATLLSMFYFTTVFDFIFNKPPLPGSSPDQQLVQKVLKEGIVNPLRSFHYVRADKVLRLRELLDKLGTIPGMMGEEKDPEEFLSALLSEIMKADPLLHLSSGEHTYFYQLFIEKDEKLLLPTTQILVELSFLQGHVKLKEVPSCLILQMPRFGKDYKMYGRIIPSLELDITDILETGIRECIVCGALATFECRTCYQQHGQGLNTTAFCEQCIKKSHQHKKRQGHNPTPLLVPPEFITRYAKMQEEGGGGGGVGGGGGRQNGESMGPLDVQLPREKMELFAVVCIQTSHYVSFVKCGKGKDAPWVFFDSMADRMGEQGGYNIPEVQHVPELSQWLSENNFEHILKMGDDRSLPEHMRRLLCDAYMVMYQSPSVMMFR